MGYSVDRCLFRNSTRSLYDSDVVYNVLHGRRYCKDYYMPNDEDEQNRQQMLHSVYYSILGNRLTTVPLQDPKKILDIGTGTGEWAMAMGDEYPSAEVIGTDIAKIQPTGVPLNVFFEIDDAEEEGGWAWPADEFDLVHLRYMAGAFKNWKYIYQQAYANLQPGGWIEVLDIDTSPHAWRFFEPDSVVHQWFAAVLEGSVKSGRPCSLDHIEPDFLSELGFVDVSSDGYEIPMGSWCTDDDGQKTGTHFLVAMVSGVEAVSLRQFSEHLNWDHSEIHRLTQAVKEMIWNTALDPDIPEGMLCTLKVLKGRKPNQLEVPKSLGDRSSSRTVTMTEAVEQHINGVPTQPSKSVSEN